MYCCLFQRVSRNLQRTKFLNHLVANLLTDGDYKSLLSTETASAITIAFSILRKPYSTPTEADYAKLNILLSQVDKLWKQLDLSYTPKYHALKSHALPQMKKIGGLGDMLADSLEKKKTSRRRYVPPESCPVEIWREASC